jgi:hypothetical protein
MKKGFLFELAKQFIGQCKNYLFLIQKYYFKWIYSQSQYEAGYSSTCSTFFFLETPCRSFLSAAFFDAFAAFCTAISSISSLRCSNLVLIFN